MKILKSFLATLLTMCMFIYMGCVFYNQQIKLNDLHTEIGSCERKIQEKKLETEKLTTTISSMSDDEYIEEVARERLGLVMPTEIIFMDSSI